MAERACEASFGFNYLTVLTQKNFVAEFYRENVKQRSSVSEPPFGGLGDNVCNSQPESL